MVKFLKITDQDNEYLDKALDIYVKSFPSNERHPVEIIKQRIRKGLSQVYIGHKGKDVAFMALLWPLKNTDFILLDYMATGAAHRGKNIATSFLKEMHQTLKEENKYLIMEVENPAFGNNKNERQKRVDFYKKNGAKELKSVRYILPALQGSETTEMILMILPDYKNSRIDAPLVKNLITQIYKELYNRDAKEELFSSSLYDSNNQIELI